MVIWPKTSILVHLTLIFENNILGQFHSQIRFRWRKNNRKRFVFQVLKKVYFCIIVLINDNNIIQQIFTTLGYVLTVHFLQMQTDKNDSAIIEVYDGTVRLLATVKVRNGTLPQSVTSTGHNLFIKFIAEPRTNALVFVRVSSGYSKFNKNLHIILDYIDLHF